MKAASIFYAIAVAVVMFTCTPEQPEVNYETALQQIRGCYFAQDFEEGFIQGKKFVSYFPDSVELKAWYLLNWNMNHYWNHDNIIPVAREMLKKNEDNPWGYFALAGIYIDKVGEIMAPQAKEFGEKAFKLDPQNPLMQWMRLKALNLAGEYEAVIKYVDENEQTEYVDQFLVLKGQALKGQGLTPWVGEIRDELKWQQALQTFNKALEYRPHCVNAVMEKMQSIRPEPEDIPILQEALKISPYSNRIRTLYWHAVLANHELNDSQKRKVIETDIEQFLQERSSYPSALLEALRVYLGSSLNDPEKQKQYSDTILERFPNSYEAEWVLIHDMRAFKRKFGDQIETDSNIKKEWYEKLWNYTKRPQHHMESLLGEVYYDLYRLAKADSTLSNKELKLICMQTIKHAFGRQMQKAKIQAEVAILLSERIPQQKGAEKVALESIELMKESLLSMKPQNMSNEEWLDQNGVTLATLYDALGWIQFDKDEIEEAEKNLLFANDQYAKNNAQNSEKHFYYMGQLYEKKKEFENAESFYIEGAKIATPRGNPNEKALESLYIKLNGNADGFGEYLAKIKNVDADSRKKEILASRMNEPIKVTDFLLKSTGNEEISLGELASKVVVINFWYIGCYWCQKEFPEFQQLYEKYKNSPDVEILTINSSDTAKNISEWMQENGYNFTVLLDNGYTQKSNVQGFPTTWFIDKNDRIVFQQIVRGHPKCTTRGHFKVYHL